ncbi:thioredoxin family protein [bacterium]|nr:thioredoxin family protein [bacterium]
MALMYTPPGEIGSLCPNFQLPGTDGNLYQLKDFKGSKALLVMFICNHCPYVQAVEDRLVVLSRELLALGAQIVAISSNDSVKYPADSFENMKKRATEKKYPFPYLFDETQNVAKEFAAVCTPDFFVYDENLSLAYRGRLDDSWKNPAEVSRHELRHAMLELLAGREAPLSQYPSMGCSIKWKSL